MPGEPKFGEWKSEVPHAEQSPPPENEMTVSRAESSAEREKKFDFSRIQYFKAPRAINPEEEPRLAKQIQRDHEFCERLEQGEKFAFVFGDSINFQGISIEEGDSYLTAPLYKAKVIMADESNLSFDHLQAAAGLNFRQDTREKLAQGTLKNTNQEFDEVCVDVSALEQWLQDKFGDQYVGLVKLKYEFGQDEMEKADKEAASLIQGDSADLQGLEESFN